MEISSLFSQKKMVFSLEIFPPKKNFAIDTIYSTLEGLCSISPDYISITYGAGGSAAENKTCELAHHVKSHYGIEPLAHLSCINSTRDEVRAVLKELSSYGICNILALRGDRNPDIPPKQDFLHAADLIEFIKSEGNFHIAAACYPEGHPESDSIGEDIRHLKAKVDCGAEHLISQLFFDNEDFYRFLDLCQAASIDVPIEPGIMPVVNTRQIERMVSMCGAKLPKKFSRIMARYEHDEQALKDAGIAYACEQIIDLVSSGVKGVHLYTMNKPDVAKRIYENLKSIITSVNR